MLLKLCNAWRQDCKTSTSCHVWWGEWAGLGSPLWGNAPPVGIEVEVLRAWLLRMCLLISRARPALSFGFSAFVWNYLNYRHGTFNCWSFSFNWLNRKNRLLKCTIYDFTMWLHLKPSEPSCCHWMKCVGCWRKWALMMAPSSTHHQPTSPQPLTPECEILVSELLPIF